MRALAFDKTGIVLEPYDDAALKRGKTADFKLLMACSAASAR
jgi:hypothetical protein